MDGARLAGVPMGISVSYYSVRTMPCCINYRREVDGAEECISQSIYKPEYAGDES